MKKYLITSPKFAGTAELLYSNTSVLQKIDCQATDMIPEQIQKFKQMVPVLEGNIPELAKSTSLTIVSEDYVITYEQFWNAYDNKVNNKRALALWDKLSHVDKVAAFVGIKIYNRHLQKNPWKTKADPDTYLRNRSWENNYK